MEIALLNGSDDQCEMENIVVDYFSKKVFYEKQIEDGAIKQLFASFEPGHLISKDLMHLNYPITSNEL